MVGDPMLKVERFRVQGLEVYEHLDGGILTSGFTFFPLADV
jgi:hypothetical protein